MEEKFQVSKIGKQHPLIHVNGNVVTIRPVVDMILAAGASAIAATAPEEAEEITGQCDGLLLNMGTPSTDRVTSMLLSGKAANEKGIPVVLDPVGVGASSFRNEILKKLLHTIHFTCIRGNSAEMAHIAGVVAEAEGVDGRGTAIPYDELIKLSNKLGTVLAVSGEEDVVFSPNGDILSARGGSYLLSSITGGGCMLSGLIAAGLSADPDTAPARTVQEVMQQYKNAAQLAETIGKDNPYAGTGSFRMYLTDAVSQWKSGT